MLLGMAEELQAEELQIEVFSDNAQTVWTKYPFRSSFRFFVVSGPKYKRFHWAVGQLPVWGPSRKQKI